MVNISVGRYRRCGSCDVVTAVLSWTCTGGNSMLDNNLPDTVNIRIGTVGVVVVALSLMDMVLVPLGMGSVTTAIGPPLGQPTHFVMVVLDNIMRGFEKFVFATLLDCSNNDRAGKLARPYCCCDWIPGVTERSRFLLFIDEDVSQRTFE